MHSGPREPAITQLGTVPRTHSTHAVTPCFSLLRDSTQPWSHESAAWGTLGGGVLGPVSRPSQFADSFSDRAWMLQTGGERQVGKKPTGERGKGGRARAVALGVCACTGHTLLNRLHWWWESPWPSTAPRNLGSEVIVTRLRRATSPLFVLLFLCAMV